MCGRLDCSLCKEDLINSCTYRKVAKTKAGFKYIVPRYTETTGYAYKPLCNVVPRTIPIPVMLNKNHSFLSNVKDASNKDSCEFVIAPMRWGLIRNTDSSFDLHNVRLETLRDKQFFKSGLESGKRCVILCDGYYEWQNINKSSQPFYFYPEPVEVDSGNDCWIGLPLLKLAGIFDCSNVSDTTSKISEGSSTIYSTSIITKPADDDVKSIHHRMPVILDSYDDVNKWLDTGYSRGLDFLIDHTLNSQKKKQFTLKYYPVEKKYTNASNSTQKCARKTNFKRQATLDNFFNKKGPAAKK